MMPCVLVIFTDVSKEFAASIFGVVLE